jgi:hypothetical protein
MAFTVEKRIRSVLSVTSKQSFGDYSHRFACRTAAISVMWKSVEQLRQTGSVNIPNVHCFAIGLFGPFPHYIGTLH